jgi:hypothetical protein
MEFIKIDTEKLSELIKDRMRERKITVSKVSTDLQWPRSLAAMVIQGQRSVSEKRLRKLRISPIQGSEMSLSPPQRRKFNTFNPF